MKKWKILIFLLLTSFYLNAQTDSGTNDDEGLTDYENEEEYYSTDDYDPWTFIAELIYEIGKTTVHVAYKFPNETSPFIDLEKGGNGFTKYPYREKGYGLYYEPFGGGRSWSGEVRGHYYLGSPVSALFGGIRFSPAPALNLDLKYHFLIERLNDGTTIFSDFTTLGATYNRIRRKRINFYWGIGGTTIRNFETSLNFSFLYGGSIYLFKPLSLHYQGQYTWVWGDVNANIHEIFLKLHLKQYYFYFGPQFFNYWDYSSGSVFGIGMHF